MIRINAVEPLRIGIVGCGAVTQLAHLPACAAAAGVKVTALVDPNIGRAEQLAKEYGVAMARRDTAELAGRIDGAIVAAPHACHADISVDLLRQGIHVLVEKPMALTAAECDAMIKAARDNKAVLAVGLMRRFAPWARYVKQVALTRALGRVRSFQIREGGKYSWPVASDFFFKKATAGGGVLIDTGAHTLDTVLWWFGDVASYEYYDDAEGGVEADCELRLVMKDGCVGRIDLSRTRNLGFRIRIEGERDVLEIDRTTKPGIFRLGDFWLQGPMTHTADAANDGTLPVLIAASLGDWLAAIRSGTVPTVTGSEGRRSIELIEGCYRNRRPLLYPWLNSISNEESGIGSQGSGAICQESAVQGEEFAGCRLPTSVS
jgi:predicted dehydrogenase